MLSAISKFFSSYGVWVIVAAGVAVASAVGWMFVDLKLTKAALETSRVKLEAAEQTIEAQQRAIEAVDRVEELSDRLEGQLRTSTRQILEADGATNEVPPDVAAAWAAGIDGLRNNAAD